MAQELRPLYLIAGSDRPKVELAVGRLRGRFDAAAVESLSAVESSGADAVAACNALGLFGSGHRLVLAGVGPDLELRCVQEYQRR